MKWCVHRTTYEVPTCTYLTLPTLPTCTYLQYLLTLHSFTTSTLLPIKLTITNNQRPTLYQLLISPVLHTPHHAEQTSPSWVSVFIHFILTPPPCDIGADLSRPPLLASSSPRLASHPRRHRANCTSVEKHNRDVSWRLVTGIELTFFFLLGLASKLAAAQGGAAPVSNFTQQGGQGGYVRTFSRVTHS